MSTDSHLLDTPLTITHLNQQKYDRVTRLTATHDTLLIHLDVHHELFPVALHDTLHLVLASTLSLTGTMDDDAHSTTTWRDVSNAGASRGGMGGTGIIPIPSGSMLGAVAGMPLQAPGLSGPPVGATTQWASYNNEEVEGSLADQFDYVCYGRVYRFEEGGENIKVYASFGGLLLYVEGPHKRLSNLRIENVYLLLKK